MRWLKPQVGADQRRGQAAHRRRKDAQLRACRASAARRRPQLAVPLKPHPNAERQTPCRSSDSARPWFRRQAAQDPHALNAERFESTGGLRYSSVHCPEPSPIARIPHHSPEESNVRLVHLPPMSGHRPRTTLWHGSRRVHVPLMWRRISPRTKIGPTGITHPQNHRDRSPQSRARRPLTNSSERTSSRWNRSNRRPTPDDPAPSCPPPCSASTGTASPRTSAICSARQEVA